MNVESCKRNKSIIALTIILLLSLGIRLCYIIKYPIPVRDALNYKRIVEEWIDYGTFMLNRNDDIPPLFLYIVKELHISTEIDILSVGTIVNMIAGLFIVMVIFLIGNMIFKNLTLSIFLGLIAASHPKLISFSCQMLRENTYLLGVTFFLYFLLSSIRKITYGKVMTLGIITSVTVMIRHEGLELLLLTLILLVNQILSKKIKTNKLLLLLSTYMISILMGLFLLNQIMGIKLEYYNNYINQFQLFVDKFSIPI